MLRCAEEGGGYTQPTLTVGGRSKVACAAMFFWSIAFWIFVATCLIRSQFDPDEYFQTLEPSLCFSFPTCHKTWEWDNAEPLRSHVPLLPYMAVYKALSLLHISPLTAAVPRNYVALYAVSAVNGSMAFALSSVSSSIFGLLPEASSRRSLETLFHTSWFLLYCATRSYSNVVEALLCLLVLLCALKGRLMHCSVLSALALSARFTSLVFTAPAFLLLCGREVFRPGGLPTFARLVTSFLFTVAVCHSIDCGLYGLPLKTRPTFVSNIIFNVLEGNASLYGTHPWYWYIFAGTPAVMGTTLVPYLYSLADPSPTSPSRQLLSIRAVTAIYVGTLSLSAHKEFRFILPVVPLMMMEAALGLERAKARKKFTLPFSAAVLVVALNFGVVVFLGRRWQAGGVSAMLRVGELVPTRGGGPATVDVLAGCHSMPEYSHVFHAGVRISSLDCGPHCRANGDCESDEFRRDPGGFARKRYQGGVASGKLPSYIVVMEYDRNARHASDYILATGMYKEHGRWWHTFEEEAVLLEKKKKEEGGKDNKGQGTTEKSRITAEEL